ncbi:MAG: hypothetical protein IPK64_00105 [bacterium]|nr:hypothetical protein [bacterium]
MSKPRGRQAARILAALAILPALAAAPAWADELEDLLEDVTGQYAQAYLAPFTHSFGPNLNSGIFHTAAIPRSRLTIELGIKATATHLVEADQSFQKVIDGVDLSDYDDSVAPGTTGYVVMSGPTVFGDDETPGTVTGYVGGVQVFSQETIEGLVDTRFSPMAVPQASVGGIAGLRATVRWLPELKLGDFGKIKVFGYGLQWSPNIVAPTLPVDVMVGFFNQTVEFGTLIEADASTMFVAASKAFALATVYAGYAMEDSEIDVAYTYSGNGSTVGFTAEGTQESRVTVGATLNVLAKLNLEMGHGDLTTYTAGLMFGF